MPDIIDIVLSANPTTLAMLCGFIAMMIVITLFEKSLADYALYVQVATFLITTFATRLAIKKLLHSDAAKVKARKSIKIIQIVKRAAELKDAQKINFN